MEMDAIFEGEPDLIDWYSLFLFAECGGVLTGETGDLRFPPAEHSRYPHGISCAWRIVTSLNKVIKLLIKICV